MGLKHVWTLGAIVLLQSLAVSAADGDWTFDIRGTYRTFDDMDFSELSFRNVNNANVVNGPFGVQGYDDQSFTTAEVADGTQINADYLTFTGEGEDSDSVGVMLGLGRKVRAGEGWTLSVLGHVAHFGIDVDTDQGNVGGGHTLHTVSHQGGNAVVLPQPLALNDGPAPGTTATMDLEVDGGVFVLDLGLQLQSIGDRFQFTLAAGPTLSFAELDVEYRPSATWNPVPGTGDTGTYQGERVEEDDSDVVLGGYVALGADWRMNVRWSLGVEYRYDVAGDVNTDVGDMSLNGHSIGIVLRRTF